MLAQESPRHRSVRARNPAWRRAAHRAARGSWVTTCPDETRAAGPAGRAGGCGARRMRRTPRRSARSRGPHRPDGGSDWVAASERNVAVLPGGIAIPLGAHRVERVDEPRPGIARIDNVVEVATSRGNVGVGEARTVLLDALLRCGLWIRLVAEFLPVQDFDGAARSHHGNFRSGPGHIEVAANVLAAHHVVGAAVCLARDDREFGHGRLAVREEQLGAVLDDAAVLLCDARKKSGHVLECDERNVERIAEAD